MSRVGWAERSGYGPAYNIAETTLSPAGQPDELQLLMNEKDQNAGCIDPGDGIPFLPYSHSMELHNDPRFFASNVIEKRLQAFAGLSVISSLTTGTAMGQCFKLSKDFDLHIFEGWVQAAGFITMSLILFMSLVATLVFVYQSFFTHRLVTAGPTGFELAQDFYLNPSVVQWRHFGVQCLGIAMPLLLFSTGCMLYVKVKNDNHTIIPITYGGHVHELNPFALITLILFTLGSAILFYIRGSHDNLFQQEYRKREGRPKRRGELDVRV